MNIQWQALFLVIITLVSLMVTRIAQGPGERSINRNVTAYTRPVVSVQGASLVATGLESKEIPSRKWDVLDPTISARAALVELLPEKIPLYHLTTSLEWPLASLTKFMAATVLLEGGARNKKIEITENDL